MSDAKEIDIKHMFETEEARFIVPEYSVKQSVSLALSDTPLRSDPTLLFILPALDPRLLNAIPLRTLLSSEPSVGPRAH